MCIFIVEWKLIPCFLMCLPPPGQLKPFPLWGSPDYVKKAPQCRFVLTNHPTTYLWQEQPPKQTNKQTNKQTPQQTNKQTNNTNKNKQTKTLVDQTGYYVMWYQRNLAMLNMLNNKTRVSLNMWCLAAYEVHVKPTEKRAIVLNMLTGKLNVKTGVIQYKTTSMMTCRNKTNRQKGSGPTCI